MQRQFTISTPAQAIRTDANGHADVVFTVANTTNVPNAGMARLVPLGATRPEWLALAGAEEREFAAGAMHQYAVAVNVPADAPEGRYPFRLDVINARKSAEDHAESPIVTVEVPARAAAAKSSRSWMAIAAVTALLVLGGVGYLMFRSPDPEPTPIVTETADTTATVPTATVAQDQPIVLAQVPDVTASAMLVTDAMDWLQSSGFRTEITADTNAYAPRGTVVRQSPAPGTTGARGSTVRLTVADVTGVDLSLSDDDKRRLGTSARDRLNAGFTKAVKVPQFQNFQTDFVDALLDLQRLTLRANFDVPPNHNVNLGKVYSQSPAGGTELKAGEAVTMLVGATDRTAYQLTPERLSRLTTENQDIVRDVLVRLEKRRQEVYAGEGRG